MHRDLQQLAYYWETYVTLTKAYLQLHYGQIHYRQCGGGPRVLVLLHQVPSSSAMWERVAPLFAQEGYRVIAFDLPGIRDV